MPSITAAVDEFPSQSHVYTPVTKSIDNNLVDVSRLSQLVVNQVSCSETSTPEASSNA